MHPLQSHYPERLGRAVCFHPPRIFDLMWRVRAQHYRKRGSMHKC